MRHNLFEHAKTVALTSTYKIRHGAILVAGNSIIKVSANKTRPVRFAHKYHEKHKKNCGTLHAEVGCVLNIPKTKTKGCDIYVVRLSAYNNFANSKPCLMCINICKEMGIDRIYYSSGNNEFNFIKL